MSSRAKGFRHARKVSRRLQLLLPNPEVATIDGDNHMLPLQSPNALEQLTADLVRRHPNAA
jgi:pimeloyl-ACP methyl ester carboxylesterase